jgi:hypothetical protein
MYTIIHFGLNPTILQVINIVHYFIVAMTGGHMSYLLYLCLFGHSSVHHILILTWFYYDFSTGYGTVQIVLYLLHAYVVMFVVLILELHQWCNG